MDVTNDQLQQVSALAEIQRKLEAEVKKKEESLKETKQQLKKVSEVDIPEALAECGLSEIKLTDDLTLQVDFHRYIRDVINQIHPRYDQLTNLTGAGEAINIANRPSTIVQQNNFSVVAGGAVPEGVPNAGDFCSFIRTGEVMIETLSKNSDGVNTSNLKQIKTITFRKIDPTINTLPQNVLLQYKNALDQTSIIT